MRGEAFALPFSSVIHFLFSPIRAPSEELAISFNCFIAGHTLIKNPHARYTELLMHAVGAACNVRGWVNIFTSTGK